MIGHSGTRLESPAPAADSGAVAPAASLQFGSAAIGAVLALLTGCAVFAVASVGALLDALRFLLRRVHWVLFVCAACTAALAIAVDSSEMREGVMAPAPWMIAFGAVGLAVNALSVFAAFPHRLREYGAGCASASSCVYLLLIVLGVIGVLAPIRLAPLVGVALASAALVIGYLRDARRAP